MKKGIFKIIISYIILILCVVGIIYAFRRKNEPKKSEKIEIIATIYPNYEFAKKVGGDKVNVTMLLNSGVDTHSYEPSVRDMKRISDSDFFIYTGTSTEPWAKTIIDSLSSNVKVLETDENVKLINKEEFAKKYNVLSEDEEHNESEENYEYDGHIWLNPKNAMLMVDSIAKSLCEYDSENSSYYLENAKNYKEELEKLDEDIENGLKTLNNNVLVFGGEFAYTYFIDRYNLKYVSVYKACGEEAEPSVSDVKEVIDYINKNNISKVFYEELSEGTVAKMISEETSAKPLVFYTLHNVSKDEINSGEDYISIMRKNLKNIID